MDISQCSATTRLSFPSVDAAQLKFVRRPVDAFRQQRDQYGLRLVDV
jgi:hypothetical protein